MSKMKPGARIDCSFPLQAEANLETRVIKGVAIPFGSTGTPGGGWGTVTFAPNSVTIPGKVHALVQHDADRPVGLLAAHAQDDNALTVELKIAATSRGDEILLEAAEGLRDGLSVGVTVDAYSIDAETDVVTITAATLREVSVVTFPAFDDARVTDVAASEEETPEVSETEPVAEESTTEGVAVAETTSTVAEATAPKVPLMASVNEAFPYRAGGEFSFFADMLSAKHDENAQSRFGQAKQMLKAAQVSSDISAIIPEGYRPDLYVGELGVSTPLLDAFQSFAIADARPFRAPVFVSATNMIDDHVEGTNPTDGDITLDDLLVSPTAVSGQYTISREAILGSTPGIDMIVMNAIRQAVATKREQAFADVLLADATAGTAVAEATPTSGVLGNILDYQDARLADPSIAFGGSDLFRALALEVDGMDRPMNPYLAPTNANGALGAGARSLSVAGYGVGKSWAITGGLLALPTDAASWWSGLSEWRWEEVDGPANIRFAAFGIHAYAVLRAAGVVKFAVTPTA